MAFTDEEVQEFKNEVNDLLEVAERCLLGLEKGEALPTHYDEIFRDFHSIKGAAGMMELSELQAHMHQAENTFSELKGKPTISKTQIEYFLTSIDVAKKILNGQKATQPKFQESALGTPPPNVEAVTKAPQATSSTTPQERAGKILVVDDETEILEIQREILESAGFEVRTVSNPMEAIQGIRQFAPDTVITDVAMPQKNGVQLLGEIRSHWPDLPVIFVSGHVDKKILMGAIESGVFGVIEKPFLPHRLIESSLNAVRRHQISRLLDKTINLIMYQYSDLDSFLANQGKDDIRVVIKSELDVLLKQRRLLRVSLSQRSTSK